MQRILEPDEIQALDRSAIPRVRLPQRRELFAARAQRLRELAGDSHPIGAYLRLMAELVQAQHETLAQYHAQLPAPQTMVLAQQHGMPIVPANSGTRDPLWRDVLAALLARLEAQGELAPALATVFARLRALDVAALERQADALLGAVSAAPAWQGTEALDTALAPFIWAALQVMWTAWASTIAAEQVPYLETASLCPVCGSHPVASVVRVGGVFQGYRFTVCGLCGTEAHVVRVKCTQCDSTQGIAYQAIEGAGEVLKAETCEVCHSYRKIVYQEKLFAVEPFADDLASLTLDLLMNEAGYRRPAPHPFLWPAAEEEEGSA